MGKKMMILGGSALQVPAIKAAKELDYEIILVDYDENATGFALADVKLVVSTLDKEEVYRQALIYRPDVVITSTSDGPVRTAAYVNERLGKKPDLSYEDSLCATIKSHMRKRLEENHVPVPVYYVVENWAGFWEAVKALDGRCIVKPSDNAGSRGVTLLEGGEKTEEELRRAYDYSKGNSRNGIVMVEEFMSGAEVSVEAMTVNGKTEIISITDKYITPPPYFVEIAHSEPSRLGGEIQERIREVALQAIRAIRLQNGPSHTEIKVTEEGPKVVEIAARLGGDFITSRLVPLSTGVDLVGASVRLAAGEAPDLSAKWQRAAAIHFIQSGKGKLRRLEIGEEIFRMDGVEEAVLYKKAGDTTDGTKSSNDRLGHIITVGRTPEEAMERGRKALERICMEYEE
ncbi:MAG: ATP-grasp domain-containing protein [Kineothrix sp.]|nr:ATP-grasp domain-containing protein [Kineothrix sp.]